MSRTLNISLAFILFGCLPLLAQQRHLSLIDRVFVGDTSVAERTMTQVSVPNNPEDNNWDAHFGMPGANAEVRCIAADGDWVYVGGEFTFVGNVHAEHIARWNRRTHEWQRLDEGVSNGVNGLVLAIAVKGDSVIVGGQFLQAGGITAANIAIWNMTTRRWSAVGQGGSGDIYAYVSAIAVKGDGFYVGGRFSAMGTLIANNIAHWDGAQWRRLGSGVNQPVYALLVQGDDLYAGGEFTLANGAVANHIARWDGVTWHSMGDGFDGTVHTLAIMNDTLYAGGTFGKSGAGEMNLVSWWNVGQSRWSKFNSEQSMGMFGTVYSLVAHGDSLFVGGDFVVNGVSFISIWANGSWHRLHAPDGFTRAFADEIYSMATDGDLVYMGGLFPYVSGSSALLHYTPHLVAWSTSKQLWTTMGRGVNNGVRALLSREDGIYVGGMFISADGITAMKIARWNRTAWHVVGEGLYTASSYDYGSVEAFVADENNIYAVGVFGRRGDTSEEAQWRDISNAAAWDGARWNHMPVVKTTDGSRASAQVGAIVSFRSNVYAAINGKLMRWVDTAWAPDGIPQLPNSGISALANDHDRAIYAGSFKGVYRWDGIADAWTRIGATDDAVSTIVVDGARLFAGGKFMEIDSIRYNRIAMYDIVSGTWSTLGKGVDRFDPHKPPFVKALAISEDGLLYVGGVFSVAGGVVVNNIATWDGEIWKSLGSGTDNEVVAIAIDGDDIYVGGAFNYVGGSIPSWYFARWNATGVATAPALRPEQAQLALRVEPNPASDRIEFHYSTPADGTVCISIHDMLGREVAGVLDGTITAGTHSAMFDAAELPAGIYFCRLQGMGGAMTTQLVVIH